ncbi:MAG: S-layer homology domain-containing protein [Candidatus Margulisbacteria bacterium]|nr:S-layer homology domain-containing protein [Candidatus Margulisiibacteriota bacterium]
MKKYFVILVCILDVALPSFADLTFKDMPADHWAASSVYDLVRLGVTKGYPDGTFRGTKSISRYETAVFLSKLAKAISGEDVKSDIRSLKDDVQALKKQKEASVVSGSFIADWKMGNLMSQSGGSRATIADYRLISAADQKISDNASVKVSLDTLDFGYLNDGIISTESLATNLLAIESKVKFDLSSAGLEKPLTLNVSYGPGPKQHAADPTNADPSQVGYIYWRPLTGITANTSLWGWDVSGGYLALGTNNTGRVNTSQVTGALAYTVGQVPWLNALEFDVTGDYIFDGTLNNPVNRNLRGALAITAPINKKLEAEGKMALGGSAQSRWMVAGKVDLNDLWDTGTVATLQFSKIGAEFIDSNFANEEFYFAGVDAFNRALVNGTVNIGGKVAQQLAQDFTLVGRGELRLNSDYRYDTTKGKLTAEGGINYAIAPSTSIDAMYRVYQDKSISDTSDLAAVGLNYSF